MNQREIKFRVWDGIAMGEPFSLAWFKRGAMRPDDFNPQVDFKSDNGLWSPEAIFLQFTGVKDKDGHEIYEGDIVEYRDKLGEEETIERFTVTLASNGRFFYESHEDVEYDALLGIKPVAVIGNIYENPELLDA
jgi:uncharacterized phage protein (TIGR01671 family)